MSEAHFTPLPTSDYGVPTYRQGPTERENHLFFRVGCDMRRATLAINAATILLKLIELVSAFAGFKFLSTHLEEAEDGMDDEQKQNIEGFVNGGGLAFVEAAMVIFTLVAVAMHSIGIYGALKFKVWAVVVAAAAYGMALLLFLMSFSMFWSILYAIFLYPHIVLVKEINEGIMSDINYENVAVCCGGF